MPVDNVKISTTSVNIEALQGPYRQIDPFKARLKDFYVKFNKFLKDANLTLNEADAIEIKLQETGQPVPFMKHLNLVIKSQSSKSLEALIKYFDDIGNGWNKPYSTRVSDYHKVVSEYKTNLTKYTKDSRPPKIVLDPFEKAEPKTTNIAMGPVKVNPSESRDPAKTVKGTGNTSPADDQNNKTVFKYTDRLCLNRLIEWGYLEKDVLGEKT
jgi:hypothetical protein